MAQSGPRHQYTGTAGQVEKAQLAIYDLCQTGRDAMIDRELCLPPKSWSSDRGRRAAAGIADDVEFATKPAPEARGSARWMAGDEVYGADPGLRADLEARGLNYVLGIGCDRQVPRERWS